MKGSGLLIHTLLLLVIYAFNQANFYAMISMAQGMPQKMNIYAAEMANNLNSPAQQSQLTVPSACNALVVPCDNMDLPDRPVFETQDALNTIVEGCKVHHSLVCAISNEEHGNYYIYCRGLIDDPDRTYYLEGGQTGKSYPLSEGEGGTVKINTAEG